MTQPEIDPASRLAEWQELWRKCLAELATKELVTIGGNGYQCINHASKIMMTLNKEIARLQQELEKNGGVKADDPWKDLLGNDPNL